MKRGEVWTIAGGPGYASKPRPAVVVQDDAFSSTQSVTICLTTSELVEAPAARVIIEASTLNGLIERSSVMADIVMTLAKEKFGKRIGSLTNLEMEQLSHRLMTFLGLARS